ncbi:MAG: HisA/HisF-related TIM barrel protein, partial [Halodesulfurarchaeum sp.]
NGVRPEPVRQLVEAVDLPVVASGGVADVADVEQLADAGAAAVVVGTALYEGKFTLEEARRAVNGR